MPDNTLFHFGVLPLSISFPFYKRRIRHHNIKGIIDIQFSWKRQLFEKTQCPYLIIHDPWTENYYHWMTQALPRLLMVLKANISFTLLLPSTHCKAFHTESLKAMGIENWIDFEVDRIYYKAKNLVYPSHDIQIGDYNDDLMKELSLALKIESGPKSEKNYLFVHRASQNNRRIINDEEVLEVFIMWGFEVIDFEKLDFEEQRKVAGAASIIAGVHGAGLTNMLFMEKGSTVLELTSILSGEQYYYYTLSCALGHRYYYQKCKPEADGKTIQETNFHVDITELKKNLELMIRGSND